MNITKPPFQPFCVENNIKSSLDKLLREVPLVLVGVKRVPRLRAEPRGDDGDGGVGARPAVDVERATAGAQLAHGHAQRPPIHGAA